jgi:DNA (cytosine-5)-methyltransferase 1
VTIGSLFSGIGGLELGLERAGLGPVIWQVEKDEFCRSVLAKHWPTVTRYTDVCEVGSAQLGPVDVLCGGFPCQDVSSAGARKGLAGERSGLWFQYLRIATELRPRVVVVENVASGKKLWLPAVRAGLEAIGYRVRAFALSAADVGAPHLRRRIFVVAHLDRQGEPALPLDAEVGGASSDAPDAHGAELRDEPRGRSGADGAGAAEPQHAGWRTAQPDVVRVVHGVSRRVDGRRRKALGNAVVPQCAEAIGRMIASRSVQCMGSANVHDDLKKGYAQ